MPVSVWDQIRRASRRWVVMGATDLGDSLCVCLFFLLFVKFLSFFSSFLSFLFFPHCFFSRHFGYVLRSAHAHNCTPTELGFDHVSLASITCFQKLSDASE